MSILLGINVYAAKGDAARRQENCLESLRALEDVSLVNLQFTNERIEAAGFDTLCELKSDSRKVTGRKGARKPIVPEIFTVLAERARSQGLRYFGFTNSDIVISQAAIDCAMDGAKEAYVFSRMDYDESGKEIEMLIWGTDLFIIDAQWWLNNKSRFRPYIFGEFCWDNVCASIVLCHSNAVLLNRDLYIKHERHDNNLTASPFGWYNGLLAALDRPYFSLWCKYCELLSEKRARGASREEELALQTSIFVWHQSHYERLIQALRGAKARVRYAAWNLLRN
ncbi:MAG TPA: hypothetical protein VLR90_12405 [Blastocatellia bacterium]|nr:hypothetical protein [Blastocatellia bacterium]